MRHDCSDCGRPAREGGRQCARCYQRRYFEARPERYELHKRRVTEYAKANPRKRTEWVRAYRQRIGWYNPDLTALRAALGRLEQAVAQAARRQELRSPSQRGGDDDPEW